MVAASLSPGQLLDLHARVSSAVLDLRALQVRLGRDLLALRRLDRFGPFGTTTFPLYCEKVGLSASEGRALADLAATAEASPSVEAAVLEGGITLPQAGMVGEVLRRPDLRRPGEDWLRFAASGTTSDLRRWLDRRKEEVRSGERATPFGLFLSERAGVLFRRCGDLVSRSTGSPATPGQTLEAVCDDYLDRHDPERKAERLRGKDERAKASLKGAAPQPSRRNGKRVSVSAMTRREILRRFGDRCWVEGCPNRIYLERAHIRPVRAGGSHDAANQFQGCDPHHDQHDRGQWFLRKLTDGRVAMIDRRGVVVGYLLSDEARPPP